jgi:hypothetical protein
MWSFKAQHSLGTGSASLKPARSGAASMLATLLKLLVIGRHPDGVG